MMPLPSKKSSDTILFLELITQPVINVIGCDPSVIIDRELRDRTGPAVESCACYIFESKLHHHCLKKAQCASVRHDKGLMLVIPIPRLSILID